MSVCACVCLREGDGDGGGAVNKGRHGVRRQESTSEHSDLELHLSEKEKDTGGYGYTERQRERICSALETQSFRGKQREDVLGDMAERERQSASTRKQVWLLWSGNYPRVNRLNAMAGVQEEHLLRIFFYTVPRYSTV